MENSKTNILIPGVTFLHNHPHMERMVDLPTDHVIIDREEWEKLIVFFNERPALIKEVLE